MSRYEVDGRYMCNDVSRKDMGLTSPEIGGNDWRGQTGQYEWGVVDGGRLVRATCINISRKGRGLKIVTLK